jgi:hypothetical protein
MQFSGNCLCGAVRVTTEAAPIKVMHCHCGMCRRHSGAAFLTYAMFAKVAVQFSGQPAVPYRSSKSACRSHCGNCGSPTAFVYDDDPKVIYLPLGMFDQADQMLPSEHWQADDMLPWLHIEDGLLRHVGLPDA